MNNYVKKGVASEILLQYYFMQEGYSVLEPKSHDNPFDFVIHKDKFLKVQVKHTKTNRIGIEKRRTVSSYGQLSVNKIRLKYNQEDVDIMGLHFTSTNTLYVIEYEKIIGYSSLRELTINKLKPMYIFKTDKPHN